MQTAVKTAPAKINLYLKVTGKREDGYHTINTIFYPLDELFDVISISSAPELTISCDSPHVPCDEKNLCWQAAYQYSQHSNIVPNWHINIRKKIPIAAGMGGGSSDAATVLNILQSEYKAIPPSALHKIAAGIGADVPYFLNPSLSKATGIGDEISQIDENCKLPLLIVAPNFPVYAKWAYSNVLISDSAKDESKKLLSHIRSGNIKKIADSIHNDLAKAIFKKFPLLKILRDNLYETHALKVEISGSGPTLFAVYENNTVLKSSCAKLADELENSIEIIPVFV